MDNSIRNDYFRINGHKIDTGLYSVCRDSLTSNKILPRARIVSEDEDSNFFVTKSSDEKFSFNLKIPRKASYIIDGDILMIMDGFVRILLSRSANSNSLLVTERCDNRCLFCSQPPKEHDDEILLGMAACAIADFNLDGEIGITGGEPLVYKEKFSSFLKALNTLDCKSSLHVLTNGRALHDASYVRSLIAAANDRRVTFGIPLYSTLPDIHDKLVGSYGAWQETVKGIINASYLGFPVEIRFIPTRYNVDELETYIEFVSRAFPLISQISIMNMESKGWARKNWDDLYISPNKYRQELSHAGTIAGIMNINLRFFNYQLCFLEKSVYHLAEKSISDWKNYYPSECDSCTMREKCCGYFTSANGKFLEMPRAIL